MCEKPGAAASCTSPNQGPNATQACAQTGQDTLSRWPGPCLCSHDPAAVAATPPAVVPQVSPCVQELV